MWRYKIMKCVDCVHKKVCGQNKNYQKAQREKPYLRCSQHLSVAELIRIPYPIGSIVNVLKGNEFQKGVVYGGNNNSAVIIPLPNDIPSGTSLENAMDKSGVVLVKWSFVFSDVERQTFLEERMDTLTKQEENEDKEEDEE
jgi:hypothetical protein